MSDWFDRAFGPWYWKLYAHRDAAEAADAVGLVGPYLGDGPVLDIGCGAGRHLALLAKPGRRALGVDRSGFLLGEAVRSGIPASRLVRSDMRRLPFPDARFAGVLSMFTTFGYFATREEHAALLGEWRRVSRADGRLILDYLNASALRASLVPRSVRVVDGGEVEERRSIVNERGLARIVKELSIRDLTGRAIEHYEESVALFSPEEMHALLAAAGWRPRRVFGDYAGADWDASSPRFLVVAELEGGGR